MVVNTTILMSFGHGCTVVANSKHVVVEFVSIHSVIAAKFIQNWPRILCNTYCVVCVLNSIICSSSPLLKVLYIFLSSAICSLLPWLTFVLTSKFHPVVFHVHRPFWLFEKEATGCVVCKWNLNLFGLILSEANILKLTADCGLSSLPTLTMSLMVICYQGDPKKRLALWNSFGGGHNYCTNSTRREEWIICRDWEMYFSLTF